MTSMLASTFYVFKQVALSLILVTGILALWEIPYDDAVLPHSERVVQSSGLPTFEVKTFLKHVATRLPFYREEFQRAEKATGISWDLLAAMAYQESKWNRHAVSPTGVRGLMMLTQTTAAELGIRNRLDPKKSIEGGARYLANLYQRIPNIQMPDRMFVALAAYNVGIGHVRDAQLLAGRLGKDPHQWSDLKAVLPLLAKKQYYRDLPHRYARGWEPVHYVKRIRAYREILQQIDKNGSNVEI